MIRAEMAVKRWPRPGVRWRLHGPGHDDPPAWERLQSLQAQIGLAIQRSQATGSKLRCGDMPSLTRGAGVSWTARR